MKRTSGTFLKNILPGLVLVAIGIGGAYVVYETSFKNKVEQGFSSIEPAGGYSTEALLKNDAIDTSWLDGQDFPPVPQAVTNAPDLSDIETRIQEEIGELPVVTK